MKTVIIKILAYLGGSLLILTGMTFILWMQPATTSVLQHVISLLQHRTENIVYLFSLISSCILFLPVILILTIQLYPQKKFSSIIAGSVFFLAAILQIIAALISLSQWSFIIPEASKGEGFMLKIFEIFWNMYLSIDLPGALLFYIAGLIYAFTFWNLSRVSSLLLFLSTLALILGTIAGGLSPVLSTILTGGSIIIYGISYITIGDLTHRLYVENN